MYECEYESIVRKGQVQTTFIFVHIEEEKNKNSDTKKKI
jgi:hypothetical protein